MMSPYVGVKMPELRDEAYNVLYLKTSEEIISKRTRFDETKLMLKTMKLRLLRFNFGWRKQKFEPSHIRTSVYSQKFSNGTKYQDNSLKTHPIELPTQA